MEKRFRGILDELSDYTPQDKSHFIESRAQQVIASFKNLQHLIEASFEPDVAEELSRRLLLAAKAGDGKKFSRKLQEVRKGRNDEKTT